MDTSGLWMSLACSFALSGWNNFICPKDCFVFTEPMTCKQLFIQTGIVSSGAEYKQKYASLKIHGRPIDEYMEEEYARWEEKLWHTDNSILLYLWKFPYQNYKKVTFKLLIKQNAWKTNCKTRKVTSYN